MKTSKIIFSMLFIAGVLWSTTSNAQTRVIINAGVFAPIPPNGYIYYGPQPGYYPYGGGGYYPPRGYCGPAYEYHHQGYYNHPHHGYGGGQGYRNHPHRY